MPEDIDKKVILSEVQELSQAEFKERQEVINWSLKAITLLFLGHGKDKDELFFKATAYVRGLYFIAIGEIKHEKFTKETALNRLKALTFEFGKGVSVEFVKGKKEKEGPKPPPE